MTVCYMIAVERHSDLAQRLYGRGIVFISVHQQRIPLPRDEEGLRSFLINLSRRKGIALPALFRISRTHGPGEKRGFHGVGTFLLADERSPLAIKQQFSGVKGIPGAPFYDDYWYKVPDPIENMGRFRTEHQVSIM